MRDPAAWLLLAALVAGCASAPRYGALSHIAPPEDWYFHQHEAFARGMR